MLYSSGLQDNFLNLPKYLLGYEQELDEYHRLTDDDDCPRIKEQKWKHRYQEKQFTNELFQLYFLQPCRKKDCEDHACRMSHSRKLANILKYRAAIKPFQFAGTFKLYATQQRRKQYLSYNQYQAFWRKLRQAVTYAIKKRRKKQSLAYLSFDWTADFTEKGVDFNLGLRCTSFKSARVLKEFLYSLIKKTLKGKSFKLHVAEFNQAKEVGWIRYATNWLTKRNDDGTPFRDKRNPSNVPDDWKGSNKRWHSWSKDVPIPKKKKRQEDAVELLMVESQPIEHCEPISQVVSQTVGTQWRNRRAVAVASKQIRYFSRLWYGQRYPKKLWYRSYCRRKRYSRLV